MKNGRERIRISIDPSDLALEVISIVVAILLALTVNFVAGQIKTSYDVSSALASIVSEMADNEALIGRVHANHVQRCGILRALAERGRGRRVSLTAYLNALDRVQPFIPPQLESTAWQLAQSSQITSHFSYAARSDLTHVYTGQTNFLALGTDLAIDFRPVVYDRSADFFLITRNAALDCETIVRGETRLSGIYAREVVTYGNGREPVDGATATAPASPALAPSAPSTR